MDLEKLRALRPTQFSLHIPLLSKGMSKDLLCSGDNATLRIHCYSIGMGEKHGLHGHIEEEHVFIVLHGRAQFSDMDGKLSITEPNQGLWFPKGCFYEFYNPGPEPLVVLRFGAVDNGGDERKRVDPEGKPILGRASQNPELARPTVIEGAFFGATK